MSREEGYSSSVEIFVKMGEARFDVAQVDNEMLILREDPGFDLSGYAELVVIVDGEETEYHVFLSKATPANREVLSYC